MITTYRLQRQHFHNQWNQNTTWWALSVILFWWARDHLHGLARLCLQIFERRDPHEKSVLDVSLGLLSSLFSSFLFYSLINFVFVFPVTITCMLPKRFLFFPSQSPACFPNVFFPRHNHLHASQTFLPVFEITNKAQKTTTKNNNNHNNNNNKTQNRQMSKANASVLSFPPTFEQRKWDGILYSWCSPLMSFHHHHHHHHNNNNNNRTQRCNSRFLQSPHCTANSQIRSSGLGAIVWNHVLITSNMVITDSSAIKFGRVNIAFILALFLLAETINRWRWGENRSIRRKPLTTSFRKCHILKPENSSPSRVSNPHCSIGGRLGTDMLTITPCVAPGHQFTRYMYTSKSLGWFKKKKKKRKKKKKKKDEEKEKKKKKRKKKEEKRMTSRAP